MTRSKTKKTKRNHGKSDLISTLSNDILSSIISYLFVDQAVRSSILSKRWEHLWKHASHLDFDGTCMIKSLFIRATEEDA